MSFHLPSLRERKEDIPLLLNHFLTKIASEYSVPAKKLSPEVEECLKTYPWPGNIREMEYFVERLPVSAVRAVGLEDLPPEFRYQDWIGKGLEGSRTLSDEINEMEKNLILKALRKTDFDRPKAASLLRTTMKNLNNRIQKLKISRRDMG